MRNESIYFYGTSDTTAGTYTGNVVTITDGTNITGISLIDDHVVLRSDNGTTAITIQDLGDATKDYDNDQNAANMLFDAEDALPDTLTVEAGNELYIPSGELFTPGGTVTVSASATAGSGIDIRGTWTATGTESITDGGVGWNVDATTGVFVAASSTVTFTGTVGTTITTGGTDDSHDFNNVVMTLDDSGDDLNVTTYDMDIDGNLTLTRGQFSPTTNVYLAGNLVIDAAAAANISGENDTGDLIFDGGGLQTITNAIGVTNPVAEVQISNTSASGVRMDNAVTFSDFIMNASAKFDCNGFDLTLNNWPFAHFGYETSVSSP